MLICTAVLHCLLLYPIIAGLRSKMGAGYTRMNDLTVIQTTQVKKTPQMVVACLTSIRSVCVCMCTCVCTCMHVVGLSERVCVCLHMCVLVCVIFVYCMQGLCCYLLEKFGVDACKNRGVVVGYDSRHNSHR